MCRRHVEMSMCVMTRSLQRQPLGIVREGVEEHLEGDLVSELPVRTLDTPLPSRLPQARRGSRWDRAECQGPAPLSGILRDYS